MKAPLRYTLVGDGPSDRCLTAVIDWTLSQMTPLHERGFRGQVADFRWLRASVTGLAQRIEAALRLDACDVLFIHRDAEGQPPENRWREIEGAARSALVKFHVPLVPVRMTEAWLLISEDAIRSAADRPKGTQWLNLPPLRRLERLPDPKERLHQCLIRASEQTGRRLHGFRRELPQRVQQVATRINDFSPLRSLLAFRHFEDTTRRVLLNILENAP